jgi:DNA-binding NarL/FixJ family response regulator
VLLVDDHADVRKAVQEILNSYPDLEIVGEARDGCEAICHAERLRPDVVVMDISMPLLDGIKATHTIKSHNPQVVVIGLSVETRKSSIADMLNAGASTVLKKEAASEQLHGAIHAMHNLLFDTRPEARRTPLSLLQFSLSRTLAPEVPEKFIDSVLYAGKTFTG